MAVAKEFAKPLRLVSPHMRGQNVRDAQYLLSGHSRFAGLAPLKDSEVDAEYGFISAQATKRAKFWVGYPLSACDGVFGQTLYEYLRPQKWRPLPPEYQTRRRVRLAAVTPGAKAVEKALTQLGVKESPFGTNRVLYAAWYGLNGYPWCAMFESWCFAEAGYPWFRYAAVEQIVRDAEAGRNRLRQVWTPRRGDLACFNLRGNPYAHTAFVLSLDGSMLHTIGGNTGPIDFSNGGEVAQVSYEAPRITAYVRAT